MSTCKLTREGRACSHIMAARGSGEHALRHLLAPFARARHPLEGRLQARGPHSFPLSLRSLKFWPWVGSAVCVQEENLGPDLSCFVTGL